MMMKFTSVAAATLAFASAVLAADFQDTAPGVKGADGTAEMTFYTPGEAQFANAPDACGDLHTTSDFIVAVAAEYFDSFGTANPNNNPLCHKNIKVNFQGKSVVAQITDRCADCALKFNVDLTPAAISKILPDFATVGRVKGVTWDFTDEPVGSTGSGDAPVTTAQPTPATTEKPAETPASSSSPEAAPAPSSSSVAAPVAFPSPSPSPSPVDNSGEASSSEAAAPASSSKAAAPSSSSEPAAPASSSEAAAPVASGSFDDGFYHPSTQFDDGKYHPDAKFDNGMYKSNKREMKARLPAEY